MSRQHFFRQRRFWRYCLSSLLAAAFLAMAARNLLADAAIEHLGRFFLGNSVAVQRVRIGFKTIELTGFEVSETSLGGAPQLEIRGISLAPTIWRGLREGVWLRYVAVREPTLHLRFDRDGNLLSRFPALGGSGTDKSWKLPFDRAVVVDGTVLIHQEGKPVFTIRGASLTTTVDQSIQTRAEIADLLGSRLRVESRLDASTFAGRTKVTLGTMHLDTHQLAQLPLLPGALADHRMQGTAKAQLQIEHPADDFDPRNHAIAFRAQVADVVSARCGPLTNGIDLRVFFRNGRCSLTVEGPLSQGTLRLDAEATLAKEAARVTSTFHVTGVDLEPIAKAFAPDVPVSAIASAAGTARASWEHQILNFQATLAPTLTKIEVDGIPVGDLTTELACDGSLDPAREQPLAGLLSIKTASRGVALDAVARRFERGRAEGTIGLHASGTIPLATIAELQTWNASVAVDVRGLSIASEPLGDFTASCRLTAGELELSPCNIRWRDTVCTLVGSGDLREQARAAVDFTAGPISLRDVSDLAGRFSKQTLPISGTAIVRGRLDLDLTRRTFSAGGELTLSSARYATTRIGDARLLWEANPRMVSFRGVSDDFFGGSYVVDASLQSLDWTKTTVTASGRNIQINRLAGLLGDPLPVSGFIDGGLRFSSIGKLNSLQADGWVRTREASFADRPIELQTTRLSVGNGQAVVAIRGAAFDGTLIGEASTRLADLSAWLYGESRQIHQVPVVGRVQLKALAVKRALQVIDKQRSLAPLSGRVNIACVRDQATAQRGLLATVDCSAENLRWNQAVMSKRLRATVALYPKRLEVNKIDGTFAAGRLSGNARLTLARVPVGTFRLNAENVNLRRALAPMPGISHTVAGVVSASIAGRLGSTSTASTKIRASNISVGDLVIRELRMPVECSFQSQSSQVRWQSRGCSLSVGGGQVAISSTGRLTNGLVAMATEIDIRRVDTAKLMRGKSPSAGIIQGHVHIQSKRARTANDLTGRFHLELSQIKSLELPGTETFMQLAKLPTISGPSVAQEDRGTIDGRLAGGLLHLDSLSLSKNGLLVLMNGTATLDGRLNFDATAFTHQTGPADGLLALADSPLMLAAPAPVILLAKANEALKDRVIHIHVGGTGARPTLRLQPGKTLSQDALRFFVAGTLGKQTADIALRQQRQSAR